MPTPQRRPWLPIFANMAWKTCLVLVTVLSGMWLGMAVWIQQPISHTVTTLLVLAWALLVLRLLWVWLRPQTSSHAKRIGWLYVALLLMGMGWFFSIPAQQNRAWAADVSRQFHYERQGQNITIHNVRNFDWRSDSDYSERWETRHYHLDDITGINVATSYWMGPQIAHTLVSFDFKNQAPLVFSIEIRKEQGESFSAIGGFFRQFELALIAADEKDILYTRSNVRGEQVYFFPISHMSAAEMQALFVAYLHQADALRTQAAWYNSLTSNCTTLVYDMAKSVSKTKLPLNYRLIASGYLPNYLYDLKAISNDIPLATWYAIAHTNPRVEKLHQPSSALFSATMRQTLPPALPPLRP